MKSPWKKIKEKTVYETPWIRVDHHDVLNPAGKESIYGTVHFKNLAIGVIPLSEDNQTWIVGQHRYPLGTYSWEIPEGGGPLGIDPIISAKRELQEETGITAKKWTEILRIHTSNSVSDELGIIYLAEDLTEGQANPDDDEDLQIRKIPFEELVRKVMKGEITDSLSIAGVLKLKLLLEK